MNHLQEAHATALRARARGGRAAARRAAAIAALLALPVGPLAAHAAPPPAAEAPAVADAPPSNLRDLSAWIDYKTRHHIAGFPQEARLYYRRGLMAHEAGSHDEAVRLVRGAADLDPSFVAPHTTLAAWSLFADPSQALLQYATVLELARRNFTLQHAMVANTLYVGLQALFLGLLAAAFILILVHAQEIQHTIEERIGAHLSPETARWWAWVLIVIPFLAGLGPVLPTLLFLGWLWPHIRGRERAVFVMLLVAAAGSPLVIAGLDRLSTPIHETRPPLYGVSMAENEPYRPESEQRLRELVAQHSSNPYLHYGLAWTARRGGHEALAESEYRRALELRPDDDRILVNLGNLLAAQGHSSEALTLYQRAQSLNPHNAAAFFNASQIYTQRFDYRAASDALSRASALDFELVRNYQAQGTEDGVLALADQWLAPEALWKAITTTPSSGNSGRSLPPAWRSRIEASGWPFAIAALGVALIGIVLGVTQQATLPLRRCSVCDAVVCRRCARRRREIALCRFCAGIESRAESPEFARVLLHQHERRAKSRAHLLRTVFATLVPGYGLLALQRAIGPVVLLSGVAALVSGSIGFAPPFAGEPRMAFAETGLPVPVVAGLWIAIYALSILGYFHRVARRRAHEAMLEAPTRARVTQATRHVPPSAAA